MSTLDDLSSFILSPIASNTDPTKGAALVGYEGSTVKAALDSLNSQLNKARTVTVVAATTVGQSVFPIPGGYPINLIDVDFVGGHLINGIDYTATDGANIVLAAGLAAQVQVGNNLSVEAFGSFNVANAAQLTTLGASGGAALIGYGAQTVKQALDGISNSANPAQGAALVGWNGGTLSQFITNSVNVQLATFSSLAGLDVTKYTACSTQGYATWMYSASTAHSSANGVTIVASTVGAGCWLMLIPNILSAKACGVTGNGTTDDTAALNAAASVGPVYITGTPLVNGAVTGAFVMGSGAYFKLGASGSIVFTGLQDTINKVFDLTLGGTVDLTRVGFTRPEWGGALGTGSAHDDTNGFLWTIQSNTEMRLRKGITYGVGKLSFSNVVNFTMQGGGATMLYNGAIPTAGGQATILSFQGTTFGASANIKVFDLTFDYLNAPYLVTQRVNNNFIMFFNMVNGVTVDHCTVLSSWSAAFWLVYCNNTSFTYNTIQARVGAVICADGITHQSCGSNIKLDHNTVANNGDDGIAITWFSGNIPSTVGLTDGVLASRSVSITNNIVSGQQLSGRGIFLGGIFGGSITGNQVRNTSAYGIMLSRNTVDQYLGALAPSSNVIGNGGSGYVVNDLIEFGGGFSPMIAQVTAVSGGAVTTISILDPGVFGTVPSGAISPVSTSGVGTGLTVTFTWLANTFYNVNGVNGANRALIIEGNTLEGCALNSNDPNGGVGGMIVSESNFDIKVDNNTIIAANNVGILCSGNASITNNTIKATTLQAGGTVTAAGMPYKGAGIVTADYSASYSNYGHIANNRLIYGSGPAIWIQQGSTLDPWIIEGNISKNHGLPGAVSVDGKLQLIAPFVSDTAYGAQWINNSIRDTRNNTKIPMGLCFIASAAVKEVGTLIDGSSGSLGLTIPLDLAARVLVTHSTAGFAVGATVTGSSSGATATIASYTSLSDGVHDSLVLYQITGTFTTSDTVLDSGSVAQTVYSTSTSQGNGFIFVQQPAITIAANSQQQINVSVLGAGWGKAYAVTQPQNGPAVTITANRNSGNNVRVLIFNGSAGSVTIQAGLWVIREV
jgi:hypothetical protein